MRIDVHAHYLANGQPVPFDGQPSAYLRRFWYDTANGQPAALRCACESFGADRLLVGTDFPCRKGDKLRHAVTHIEAAGLDPADVRAIQGDNAATLLGLPGA